jgi:GTP pyrophosphokinase
MAPIHEQTVINTGPADLEAWLADLESQRPAEEVRVIRDACLVALRAHDGQKRASGEPYFKHVQAVAGLLADLGFDGETIAAAILHDVVEDTDVSLDDIRNQFGKDIARLVDGVTKLDAIEQQGLASKLSIANLQAENLRKIFLAMAEDVRVVLIKLADRTHNMRTLGYLDDEQRRRIARETLDIYAPLANRLGIWQFKWELEDLAFRYLEPDQYSHIAAMLEVRREDREQHIAHAVEQLQSELAKEGITAAVTGRPKHIYSIARKMKRKDIDFHQVFDVEAMRIMVNEIPACYAALGVVHRMWQYIPGEFDDYIATPKDNGYRSLHTAVIGPDSRTLEVQIRTEAMHRDAELGVAAHWRYKEGAKHDGGLEKRLAWLRQLLEWKDIKDAGDFLDRVKNEVLEDRVYVFTPQGDVVDLPKGSTPVDFAYHIHTEVGHRCRGAKVNGHIVPLTYTLQTGQQAEILTVKRGGPSRDWLNPHLGYIKTAKAKSRVQHWFRQQDYDMNVQGGRVILERELERLGMQDLSFEKLAHRLEFDQIEDMLAAIGRNEIKISLIVRTAEDLSGRKRLDQLPVSQPHGTGSAPAANEISILGVGDLLTHLARCCKPVPGDAIGGFITKGRGVTIHRRECPNMLRYGSVCPERLIEVDWGSETRQPYQVDVRITAFDRPGLLRDVTAVLANDKVHVTGLNTVAGRTAHLVNIMLTVEIAGIDQLSQVLAKLTQVPNVVQASRAIR